MCTVEIVANAINELKDLLRSGNCPLKKWSRVFLTAMNNEHAYEACLLLNDVRLADYILRYKKTDKATKLCTPGESDYNGYGIERKMIFKDIIAHICS